MPVTKLSEKDVLDLVRKEMERKLKSFCDKNIDQEEVDEDWEEEDSDEAPPADDTDREENTKKKPKVLDADKISVGIRVVHIDSKLEYPIIKIESDKSQFQLKNAEGFPFVVSREELEAEYELD
jgi:hypothetical protein